ncbi:MAG: hypothetical protein J6S72_03280 [Lachnospiraceae bacterium]|nr:hypothetical protein [Lachnospiraceae bacterium]MBP5652145.1 hypothetical protein [Lachnospiraceae bacterium]
MADKEKNYYDLKTDAVDRLVNANEQNSPEVSDKEIEKISGRKRFSIPNIIKVLLIKWWFSGAICFFFYFGLGTYLKDTLDQMFVLGAAMGILTDLLTNHMLTFIEKTERQNDRYKMVTVRKFWSLFLNIPYAFVILACVVYLYNLINVLVINVKGIEDTVALPVEPVLFGLFWLGFDLLFIGMKRLLTSIFRDAAKTARGNRK